MAFPPGFLDELRARVSLPDLVGKRVRLTRKGREYGGLCPFHNEKTPSFYVVEDKGFFHCFGCGAHGDAIGFLMRSESLDFIEAVERLAGLAGVAVPQQTPQERARAQRHKTLLDALAAAAAFYEKRLWSPAGARGRDYLLKRGLDDETMRRFRLGWAGDDRSALRRALVPEYSEALLVEAGLLRSSDRGGDPYDYFRERVIFPIGDRAGRVIAFGGRTIADAQPKYLNSPEHPLFEKGRVLYGLAAARVALGAAGAARETAAGGPDVIVTEGYMDVIALHRAGFGTTVAPLGTALTEHQIQELWRLAPEPVLCFDGDAAGQRAAIRALRRALPLLKPGHSLRFAVLPAGEDPDSLIRLGGAVAVAEVLGRATPLAEALWQAELAARPTDTPERRAALDRRLSAAVGEIADRAVQGEYRRFVRERLFVLGRGTARRGTGRTAGGFSLRAAAPPPGIHDAPPPLPQPPQRRRHEVLLGLLLAHPFLVAEAHEDVAALDFFDPELDRLRHAILEVEALSPGLDAEALRLHLGKCGFAMAVDAVTLSFTQHAGPLSRTSDRDAVRLGWAHVTGMARGSDRDDMIDAAAAMARDLTPETWERFLALRGWDTVEEAPEDELSPYEPGLPAAARGVR